MLRNYFMVNLILIAIIGFLSINLYKALGYTIDIPSEPGGEKVERKVHIKHKSKDFKETSFDVISDMDLFRSSRTAIQQSKRKTIKASPANRPKLFGTVILNDDKTAILEDPDTGTTKTYRINDSIAGYRVSEILEDRVVFLRDGDRIEVRLRDDKGIKPARRPKVKRRVQNRRPSPRRSRPVPPHRRPGRITPRADKNVGAPDMPHGIKDMDQGMGQ